MFIIANTYRKDLPSGFKHNSKRVQKALAKRARKLRLDNIASEIDIFTQELLGGK